MASKGFIDGRNAKIHNQPTPHSHNFTTRQEIAKGAQSVKKG